MTMTIRLLTRRLRRGRRAETGTSAETLHRCRLAPEAELFVHNVHLLHRPGCGWAICQPRTDATRYITLDQTRLRRRKAVMLPVTDIAEDATWWADLTALITALVNDATGDPEPYAAVYTGVIAAALDLLATLDPDRARDEAALLALAHPQLAARVIALRTTV